MKIIRVEHGSKEWHEARRCKVTGTKLAAVMGSFLDRINLVTELLAEEATEQSKIINPTQEMERGIAEEAFALKAFEQRTGKRVSHVGVCVSDEYDWLALSPDGLIENGGKYTEGIEVKCPDSKTAIFYRLSNMVELELSKAKVPFLGIPAQ